MRLTASKALAHPWLSVSIIIFTTPTERILSVYKVSWSTSL